MASFRCAVELEPGNRRFLSRLGAALARRGDADGAAAVLRQALAIAPDDAGAHAYLAAALLGAGRVDEAAEAAQRSLVLDPEEPVALTTVGLIEVGAGHLPTAIAALERAVARRPNLANAHRALGIARADAGDLDGALAAFAATRALAPDDPYTRYHEGIARLMGGDLPAGFALMESRSACGPGARVIPPPALPQWTGSLPERGARILVMPEQGFGDWIMMARYLPLLAQRFARVAALVPGPLLRLAERTFAPTVTVAADRKQVPDADFDWYCPVLSLPLAFGTTLETIPPPADLHPRDPAATVSWRDRCPSGEALRVGIAWQGRREASLDRFRSVPVDALAPLGAMPGIRWFSLQQNATARAGADTVFAGHLVHPMDEVHDLADMADLIASLDLVISVDTAIVHLAGSLGTPVWLLNRAQSDWRWMRGRSDSPWYPTVQIYRQAEIGHWSPVVTDVADALRRLRLRHNLTRVTGQTIPPADPRRPGSGSDR